MGRAFVALGANLGDPRQQMRQALSLLAGLPGTRVEACSSLYRTAPAGYLRQPAFLNAAVRLRTGLGPFTLLDALLTIERRLGRVRTVRFGPRTIDLDLLLYSNVCIRSKRLTLPHPRLTEREFVLVPLAEIGPDVAVRGRTAGEWARRLPSVGVVRVEDEAWGR